MDEFSVISQLSRQSVQIETLTSSIAKVEISISAGINKLNDTLEEILTKQQDHSERIKTLEVSEGKRKTAFRYLFGIMATVVAGLILALIKSHIGQ